MSNTRLGIFAKHWTPGEVKSRLAADIGREQAANVYRASLEAMLERFAGLADESVCSFWPAEKETAFAQIVPDGWALQRQCEGDLGRRMGNFFQASFTAGCGRVLLLGSDSPNLPLRLVQRAFDSLRQHRLVLGPAEDGGYFLVGASGTAPPIFAAMPWSTPDLWPATVRRLETEGWRQGTEFAVLPAWYDVDTYDDLVRLHRDLAQEVDRDDALTELLHRLDGVLRDRPGDSVGAL